MDGTKGPTDDRYGVPRAPTRSKRLARALVRWRRAQLQAAGYDEVNAHRLATDPDLDLHATMLRADGAEDDGEREPPHAQKDRPRSG
jgi:hypothetical protein